MTMKRGQLIEFKEGLFGLHPPQNMGIFFERITRKNN